MARNLVNSGRQMGQMGDGLLALRTALELFLVICPDEVDSRILLSRLYLHLNINLREVGTSCSSYKCGYMCDFFPPVCLHISQNNSMVREKDAGVKSTASVQCISPPYKRFCQKEEYLYQSNTAVLNVSNWPLKKKEQPE